MRVYLDTNIIINYSKDKDIRRIKKILDSKQTVFVFSQTTRTEQKRRSTAHYFGDLKKSIELYNFSRKFLKDENEIGKSLGKYWENSDKLENLEQSEKDEWSHWQGSKFDIPRCTFEGLLTLAQAFSDFHRFDTKGEIEQLTILIEEFKISGNDSLHAMEVHSDESDYFLSNDKRLINKLKKVKWLKTTPATPKELLDIIKEK